jgi:hypothetical protein
MMRTTSRFEAPDHARRFWRTLVCFCRDVATPSFKGQMCFGQRRVMGKDGSASCRMGRGHEWASEELIRLAEAYVATTVNLIVATDQTSFNFAD